MKLAELNAYFVDAGGEGVFSADGSPAPKRRGVGVIMNCPCGTHGEDNQLYVPFEAPLDGGPCIERKGWKRTGDTIDTLTLSPSVLRSDPDGCRWHGWIRNGEAISC